jgi:hypothetical protein
VYVGLGTEPLRGPIDAIIQGGYGRLVTVYRTLEINQQLVRDAVPAGEDLSVVSTLRLSVSVIQSSWDCQTLVLKEDSPLGLPGILRLPKCRTGARARNLSASAAPRVIRFAYSSGIEDFTRARAFTNVLEWCEGRLAVAETIARFAC